MADGLCMYGTKKYIEDGYQFLRGLNIEAEPTLAGTFPLCGEFAIRGVNEFRR